MILQLFSTRGSGEHLLEIFILKPILHCKIFCIHNTYRLYYLIYICVCVYIDVCIWLQLEFQSGVLLVALS